MAVTTQEVAPDFWLVKQDKKYKGVVRLKDGKYFAWHDARPVSLAKDTLDEAVDILVDPS